VIGSVIYVTAYISKSIENCGQNKKQQNSKWWDIR
jgi:hypothetical protein